MERTELTHSLSLRLARLPKIVKGQKTARPPVQLGLVIRDPLTLCPDKSPRSQSQTPCSILPDNSPKRWPQPVPPVLAWRTASVAAGAIPESPSPALP